MKGNGNPEEVEFQDFLENPKSHPYLTFLGGNRGRGPGTKKNLWSIRTDLLTQILPVEKICHEANVETICFSLGWHAKAEMPK